MANDMDFPAKGRITAVTDDSVVFIPDGATYELHLATANRYDGPIGQPVAARITVQARKLWTVPSGGNFLVPIFGPPRIVQGRVRRIDDRSMIVHAVIPLVVELPADDSAIDLTRGPVTVNSLVNVTCFPGAALELIAQPVGV